MRTRIEAGWSVLALLAIACASPNASDPQVQDLFARADMPEQTRALREEVILFGEQESLALDPDAAARLRADIAAATTANRVEQAALAAFASDWDRDAAQEALAWLGSATGERMRWLEQRANESNWDTALSNFVDEIIREPVPLHRVALLGRLAAASESGERAADIEAGAARIVLRGVGLVSDKAGSDGSSDAARIAQIHDGVLGRTRMQASVVFQFVYHDASDEEIEQYVLFVESPAGRFVTARGHASLRAAIDALEQALYDRIMSDGHESSL